MTLTVDREVDVLTIGFTASRVVPVEGRALIERVLKTLVEQYSGPFLFVTGACVGGDQLISTLLLDLAPDEQQRIIVPRDTSRVDPDWLYRMKSHPNVEMVMMPRGTTYRDRNIEILNRAPGANRLFGFPLYPEGDPRSRRSGTWQTIRMARNAMPQIPYDAWVLLP